MVFDLWQRFFFDLSYAFLWGSFDFRIFALGGAYDYHYAYPDALLCQHHTGIFENDIMIQSL
jgi:hypothetical protein